MRYLFLGLLWCFFFIKANGQNLIHYWNFNNTATEQDLLTPSFSAASPGSIIHIQGGTSAIQTTSNTLQGFEITNPNARNNDVSGSHLRFNNPIGGTLIFNLPTTGYRDVIFSYATRRSGQGAGSQLLFYSLDGTSYTFIDTIKPIDGNPALTQIYFDTLSGADDNANFKIKIEFSAEYGGTGGNNRFDNVSLDGTSISGGDLTAPSLSFDPADQSINVGVNSTFQITFSEDIRNIDNSAIDNSNAASLFELRENDSAGSLVAFTATINGRVIQISPNSALKNNQNYYLALKANMVEDLSNNSITSKQAITFKTIAVQTQFQKGDLMVVAYRMNATGADDEIALLTLVDILPGTLIRITDAKYTTNGTAQCPGGLIWTAPQIGVAAGTVISIKNDVPSVSIGSLSGSGFGLSSGGDQIIIYTGENINSNHITALSSNVWLQSNASCSGSLSMLPSSLNNGVNAIELGTANGNINGNSANAYFMGSQEGSIADLKSRISNNANWVISGSGTAPQNWPTWAFPGPPSVISASVLNQNSIRVIFNRDLESASAVDFNNFTGINGLSNIIKSNNGILADTLILEYSNPFNGGQSYQLQINGVRDTELRTMFGTYTFNFTYTTVLGFATRFTSVEESAGTVNIQLNLSNPSNSSVDVVVKTGVFSTANNNDFTYSTRTINFTGNSNSIQSISIPVIDDILEEQDEYLVISLENPIGLNLGNLKNHTLFIRDNDRKAPAKTGDLELIHVNSFKPDAAGSSTCEIVVYDKQSKRIITTSAVEGRFDIADFSNPAAPNRINSIDMLPYGGVTSVSVYNGLIAVASPNANEQLNGSVVFFDIDGNFLKQVIVGALPDMITFSPDGKWVLTANEGQPNANYSVDPEGSISIIDLSAGIANLTQNNVRTAFYTSFNAQENSLINSGVRKLKLSSTLSQDFEPEYITVNSNSTKAWVSLQENNAIAEIDIINGQITSVWAMGTKDFNQLGNGFDASDNSGFIHLSNYNVKAFFIPDAIASYSVGGKNYIISANEGDEKEYDNFEERTTVAALSLDTNVYPNASVIKENHHLGRFRVTNLNGDANNDGFYEQIYCVGSRSFSIFDADAKSLIFDSGDDFELITSKDSLIKNIFNADNEGNGFKGRSRAKGPEPEGVCVAQIEDKFFAFVALERVGGVMVYDVTDPNNPKFVDYKNSRSITSFEGDHGPEGIIYISENESPNGKGYILVANEISGTISIFEVKNNLKITNPSLVQFPFKAISKNERDNFVSLALTINPPAQTDGKIVLSVRGGNNTLAGSDFAINGLNGDSLNLNVSKGSSDASFVVNLIDNGENDGTDTVYFGIRSVSRGFRTNINNSLSLIINDARLSVDRAAAAEFKAWPNPVSGILKFSEAKNIQVIDINGKVLIEKNEASEVDMSLLSPGIYLIKDEAGNSLKVIKQ